MSNIPMTNDHNPTTDVLHPYDKGPTLLWEMSCIPKRNVLNLKPIAPHP
jgi:hypothetical protein